MENGPPEIRSAELAMKIARLVEERGWNQEDFARITQLNRQTIRDIMQGQGERRFRPSTVSACARALGLTVNELRMMPLERLLPRMHTQRSTDGVDPRHKRLFEEATQPELLAWLERNPDRARLLTADEIDELLSLQGTGGPLTSIGVQHFVDQIERRRKIVQQVQTIAGTEYIELLEQLVGLLYDKVQPYRDRA